MNVRTFDVITIWNLNDKKKRDNNDQISEKKILTVDSTV